MYSGSITRTTNSFEGFHLKFNEMFYSTHRNMYQFIGVLKNCQKNTYIKICSSTQIKKIRLEICEKKNFLKKQII